MAPAMTPVQALETIASVRLARERLTARAAGIVWLVWGLALTLLSFQTLFAQWDAATSMEAVAGGWGLELAGVVLAVALAALLTNAVWRAHALEAEPLHPAWVPYAAGLAVLLALSLLVISSNWVAAATGTPLVPSGLWFAPVALVAACGAATIAVLQRRRVPAAPGLSAAGALLAVFAVARFVPWGQAEAVQFWGSAALAWCPAVAFALVALWTFRQA